MNFMKNSLFQRNLEQEREEEMPEEGSGCSDGRRNLGRREK